MENPHLLSFCPGMIDALMCGTSLPNSSENLEYRPRVGCVLRGGLSLRSLQGDTGRYA